jgi:hypothetical protein
VATPAAWRSNALRELAPVPITQLCSMASRSPRAGKSAELLADLEATAKKKA